ncbi:MAG: ATPase P [Caldilineae bacterium]|nr:MAG: ATPase P [Caldilineae bacterium]
MLAITIPDFGLLQLHHLVLDFNGTMARDGELLAGVSPLLEELAAKLQIHVLTADTFGRAASQLAGLPCRLTVLPPENQAAGKQEYVRQLDASQTVCVGNGRNDRLMLKEAALGIAVVQTEGAAVETLLAADVVAPSLVDALELLTHPRRLVATLRA